MCAPQTPHTASPGSKAGLFHARDLSSAKVAKVSKKPDSEAERGYHGLLALRHLHRELDLAIRDAYGWADLDLGHDFHEVETLPENDRVRYTISPAARKEVLRRLLALNHARAEVEATKARVRRRNASASRETSMPEEVFSHDYRNWGRHVGRRDHEPEKSCEWHGNI